ncbi:hypothetical protein [Methylocystis parvus]|uniref:NADH-quinone oxidoreductase subunit E n=1 Tax=Methylocystis parvus TaxID=134 RepID=A0A6B8M5J7_9HYPH|nr:hypothetical protein [Methylocystis parvus]QGM98211.1 hypothetical protein F7D14_12495 [Methylocystis parvus]WBK01463.1 hypothetical protein MMG94_07080 [Methylocystis parvus OBBP]
MIHLFTLGWPWLAGAFALGALIGFVTYTRARDASFSGGWIVVAGLLALGSAIFVSYAETLEGRDAAVFDIGLALSLAYAAGLPLGGFLKGFGGGAAQPKRLSPAPVVVAPIRVESPEPLIPSHARAANEEASWDAVTMSAPVDAASAADVAPAPSKKKQGVRPELLSSPRNDAPDDLSRIKGVGPKSLVKLNALGVFHYDQIAAWNLDNAKWIGAAIGAPGRVERDKWIQQARALAGEGAELK